MLRIVSKIKKKKKRETVFSGCLKGRGMQKMGNRVLVCKNEETGKPIPSQVRMRNPPSC